MSLALQHGKHCKPPVSRCGNKHGYALAILRVMGLRPGQGAESYLIAEPDPGCRALLHAYTDPALMREAAEIIRGWKDEDPRALWERLRAEGPIKDFGARSVASWSVLGQSAYRRGHPESGFDDVGARAGVTRGRCLTPADTVSGRASELARYLQVTASNRLINIDSTTMRNSGQGGTTFGGSEFATPAETVSEAAREVARHTFVAGRGFHGSAWGTSFLPIEHPVNGTNGTSPECSAGRFSDMANAPAGLPATIVEDARDIHPPPLPDGCVCYIDPPYVGTTGYGSELPREQVCELARRWADAGAAVYISETEPLPALMAEGWQAVDITTTRHGQRRTFSTEKGRTEWVTMNRPPAWVPAIQQGLFG